jgi:hypothetical protein
MTEVSAGTGKLQETDNIWRPAAWLKTTRAFKPLAKHRSYSAINSAAMTAGCGGRVCSTARAPSPRTTLAHVGVRGELQGWGWVSWQLAGAAGSPATPQVGEARWRGAQQGDRTACIPPPAPARGGEEGDRSSVRVERREPSLTGVSSELDRG